MKAEVEKRLEKFGVGGLGRDFVVKALDPACTLSSPGIPDPNAVDVVRPEYRVQATISSPPGASTWDLYMWSPPGDLTAMCWAAAPGPNVDFSTVTAPLGALTGQIALSTTDVLSTGQVQLMSILPTMSPFAAGVYTVVAPSSKAWSFRHTYKSITAELVAADINNQGTIYAAQYPWQPISHAMTVISAAPIPPNLCVAASEVTWLPFNEADMTLSAPECYIGPAKKGVYMPHRMTGPSQSYARVTEQTPLMAGLTDPGSIGLGALCLSPTYDYMTMQWPKVPIVCRNDTGAPVGIPWVNAAVNSNSLPVITNTGFDNMNCGVQIWRGLAGGGGGGGFAASVQVKLLVGLEIMPRPTSIDRVFCKAACAYDPRALEAYYAIALELDDAYPASYNALGLILPLLANIAKRLWPTIKSGVDYLVGADPPRSSEVSVVRTAPPERAPTTVPQPQPQPKLVVRTRSSSARPAKIMAKKRVRVKSRK